MIKLSNREIVKVAAIQMECVPGDKAHNLKKTFDLLDESFTRGAKLVVLPELFSTGYRTQEVDAELAEEIPGETTRRLENWAKDRNVYVTGSILELGESKGVIYDTAVFISPRGFEGIYRKIFLWDTEKVRFKRATSFPLFSTSLGKIGIQICYEVGFPEGARILTLKGADILVYPSAFGAARLYVWNIATRSRALENGVFVIAANRSGKENEIEFAGHSRIVDPKGDILSEAKKADEVIVSEIDLASVTEQRNALPYLRDYDEVIFARNLGNSV